MAKTRVYELARELKIESRLILDKIKDIGITVASHQSTLTDAQVVDIRKAMQGEVENVTSKSPPKVIRRRRRAAAPAPEAPEPSAPAQADVAAAKKEEAAAEEPKQAPTLKRKAKEAAPEAAPYAVIEPEADKEKPQPQEKGEDSLPQAKEDLGASAPAEKAEPQAASVDAGEAKLSKEQPKADPKPPEAEAKASQEAADAPEKPKTAVKSSGGARILRRATPEEVASSRAAAERAADARKSKHPPRRERPAGGPSGSAPDGAPSRPKPAYKTKQSNPEPEMATPDELADYSRPQEGKRGRGARHKKADESEVAAKRPAFQKDKRSAINTRTLLSDPEGSSRSLGGKKRMVYTPSAQNKRRDHKRRKDLKKTEVTVPRAAYRVVKMGDQITVSELGMQLGVKGTELIGKLVAQGVMVTLNESIDFDTASLIAADYKFEVRSNKVSVEDLLERGNKAPSGEAMERSPIVTIMGHVDHGKTSILDAIRKAKVADGEAGGITQHIGAYSVEATSGKRIAFLDTPGHEAFTAMRQRGAKVTDIVILVVAADDGVMPQTVEAISHARDAGVPIIVAINKIDKPSVNFDRVYTELTEHGVQSEEWGGDTQFVKVSALEGTGLEDLLDAIALQAEILELKAQPDGDGRGIVVEGHLEGGRGPIATVMVQDGTLRVGDLIVAGKCTGKVRAMQNDQGVRVEEAGPATPVEIVGLDSVPMAGDPVHKMSDEKTARELIALRVANEGAASHASAASTLEALLGRVTGEERPVVPVIIKGDTQGSVEAICESIGKLNTDRVENKVVHKAVGGLTESDVRLAATSGAVLIGFNVRLGRNLSELAERYGVPIKYFSIIYEVVDAVKALMAGKLPPIQTEVIQGRGEVRQTIKVPKIGMVAGTAILDGKVTRNSSMRLIRDDIVIFTGKIGSLRRFKDDVKEVSHGYECGIGIEGCSDVKEGDVIESFIIEEEVATL